MNAHRAGQRVRIEWPDGSAVEGTLGTDMAVKLPNGKAYYYVEQRYHVNDGRTVTVLAEPRPEEPTGLGAVVEAAAADVAEGERLLWVRARTEPNPWRPSREVSTTRSGFYRLWDCLIDPVVLSEGWTP